MYNHPSIIKQLLIAISISVAVPVFGQDYYTKDRETPKTDSKSASQSDSGSTVYLGVGSGINNDVGIIGIGGKVKLYRTLFIRGGAGISTWGTKLTIGVKYERKHTRCWGYSLSYSSCSGLKDFKSQLETAGNPPVTKDVTLDLLRASAVNAAASYNWYLRRNKLIYIEFGYSIPIETDPYIVKDGSVLTETSKAVLRMIQPGGLIIGFGFMFGL